jgi:hypothetical protein
VLGEYSRGALAPDADDAVRAHIELCGICLAQIKRMEDLQRAEVARADECPADECPGWREVQERLRKRIRDMVSESDPRNTEKDGHE